MVKLTAAEEDVKDYVINHVLNTTASYSMIKLKAKDNINIKGTLSITSDDRAPILLDINKVVKRSELESFSMLGVTPIESTFPSINLYTAYPIPPTQHIPGHVFGSPNVRVPKPIRHKAGGKLMVANSEVTRTSHKRSQPSSRDISQSLTMPSVNSDHQESILHIASQSNITPITIVPETVNGGDEPQNLTIKEETTSGTENMEHSAPLNMSVKEKQSQHHNTPVNSPLLEQSEESLPNQVPPPKQQDQRPTAYPSLKDVVNTAPLYVWKTSSPPKQSRVEKKELLECDYPRCPYKTDRTYNLTRHLRTHYEELRIPCPECSSTFVDNYILKDHMASAHPKFPINGAGMVGVEIGSTTRAQSEPVVGQLLRNAEIPFTYFQPPNKRQKITSNRSSTTKRNKHSPNRNPGSTSRHRSGASGRIPREQPASHNVTASKGPTADIIKPMESNDSASNIPSIASLFQNAYPGMLEKDNNNSSTDGDDDERMSALSPSFAPNLPVFPEMMDPVVYDTAEISTASQ